MRKTYGSAALVVAAASLWATLGLFGKALYPRGISPLELASVRAAVGFLGLLLFMGPRPKRLRIAWRDLPFFALYGCVSIALFQYLYFAAVERTTVSVAAALLYTAPAFVVVLARVFYGEPLDRFRLLVLALVLAGVVLVTGTLRALAVGGALPSAAAVGFGLGAALTYGLYTLFGKHALRRYDPVRTVFYGFAFGALFLAVAAPPWHTVAAHPDALPLLLALGVFPTLVAYLLYITALRHLQAGTASMLATAEPVVAALLGTVVLGESLGADQVAGIVLVVAASVLLSRPPTARRRDDAGRAPVSAAGTGPPQR